MELANYIVRNFRAIIPSPPCCSEWINVTAGAWGFSFHLLFQWGFTFSIFSLKGPSVKHPPCRTNGIRSQGNTAYSGVSAFSHTHTERERNKLTNWGGWQHRRRLCVSEVQPGDPHMAGLSPTLSVRGWRSPSNFTLSSLAAGAGGGRWWSECCCPLPHTHTHIIWSWPDCGFTQSDPFCCQKPRSVCPSTFPLKWLVLGWRICRTRFRTSLLLHWLESLMVTLLLDNLSQPNMLLGFV